MASSRCWSTGDLPFAISALQGFLYSLCALGRLAKELQLHEFKAGDKPAGETEVSAVTGADHFVCLCMWRLLTVGHLQMQGQSRGQAAYGGGGRRQTLHRRELIFLETRRPSLRRRPKASDGQLQLQGLIRILRCVPACSEYQPSAAVCRSAAILAAALFAVHPIHSEAVAGIVGQAELLSAALCIPALLAYIRSTTSSSRFPHRLDNPSSQFQDAIHNEGLQ